MTSKSRGKSKILGQYYTPDYVVNYIIDQTIGILLKNKSSDVIHTLKILDPACGLGIFLVRALEFLLSNLKLSKNESPEKTRKLIIANQLYGIDIDDTQIAETQKNLNCHDFDANLKVFNALLPPASYDHQCDESSLINLRLRYKEHFINGEENFSIKEEKRDISEIENQIKETLKTKLHEDFKISSNIQPMPWEVMFPETHGMFDVIFGNPPWGAHLFSSDLLNFFNVGTQQVDSWSLFLERILMSLRKGGLLGFVIPNTFLLNENYTKIRKLLLDSCKIKKIVNLGEDVFPNITQPCMIIIAEKGSKSPNYGVDIVQYISPEIKNDLKEGHRSLSSLRTISCSQDRFIRNIDYQFDIFSIGFEELKEAIEKDLHSYKIQVKPLRDLVENARGVELNKNGKIVQCSSCGWWSSPPSHFNAEGVKTKLCVNPKCHKEVTEYGKTDHIVFDNPRQSEKDQPFLVGHQIDRYYIKTHKYIDSTRMGVNYKNPDLYQGPKLLLRKTGRGIKTAIDYKNRWVNQVVYLFKLKKNVSISLEYIMGVLNSKTINKYFFIKFADPYRQDFPHFTQKKFLRLPIKVPITENELHLVSQVEKIAKTLQTLHQKKYALTQRIKEKDLEVEKLDQEIQQLEKEIDKLIFNLYEITPDLQREVFSEFSI